MIKASNNLLRILHRSSTSLISHNLSSNAASEASNSAHNQTTDEQKVNFGFEQVNQKEKQGKVNQVFDNVASKYDIMNDAMSFGNLASINFYRMKF